MYVSGFFDAMDLGGGNYDREYLAADFAHYFSLFIGNGVFPQPSTGMQVKASTALDMSVSVSPGNGWINGYYITVLDDAPEVLLVPTANATMPRIDSVIAGWSAADRKINIYLKQGTAAVSPAPVDLVRNAELYEIELAQILLSAGAGGINQTMITDKRMDSTRCGIVAAAVDQIDTTDLFAQYDAALEQKEEEFDEWFADIKSQLSGDVVGNLINAINERVKYSDKATEAEALAGTDNTKWMTPAAAKVSAEAFSFKVGDILKTQRKNLGSKWALCNGASFNKDTYPEFFNVKPPEASGAQFASLFKVTGSICFLGRISDYDTALYVGSLSWENIGSDTYAEIMRLYKMDSYTGSITLSVSVSLGSQYRMQDFRLIRAGNKFICVGKNNSSPYYILVYTADSLHGPWTFVTQISTGIGRIFDLWYDETVSKIYIAVNNTNGYGRIVYAPIGALSSWTTVNVTNLASDSFLRVGDTYAFFGYGASNRLDCMYTTTPEISSWTQKTIASSIGSYIPTTATVWGNKVVLFGSSPSGLSTYLFISADSSLNTWNTSTLSKVDTEKNSNTILAVDEEQDHLFLFNYSIKKAGTTPLCVLDLNTKQQIQSYNFKIAMEGTAITILSATKPNAVIYKGWLYSISNSSIVKVPLCRFPLIPSDDSEYNYVKVKG